MEGPISSKILLPGHELRDGETVVELTVPTFDAWLSCREGVVLECPVCKKRGTKLDGGKPVALDTRAAKQRDDPRGVDAVVWQGLDCVVCRTSVTVTLAYLPRN